MIRLNWRLGEVIFRGEYQELTPRLIKKDEEMSQDLILAHEVQNSLLPHQAPDIEKLKVKTRPHFSAPQSSQGDGGPVRPPLTGR